MPSLCFLDVASDLGGVLAQRLIANLERITSTPHYDTGLSRILKNLLLIHVYQVC